MFFFLVLLIAVGLLGILLFSAGIFPAVLSVVFGAVGIVLTFALKGKGKYFAGLCLVLGIAALCFAQPRAVPGGIQANAQRIRGIERRIERNQLDQARDDLDALEADLGVSDRSRILRADCLCLAKDYEAARDQLAEVSVRGEEYYTMMLRITAELGTEEAAQEARQIAREAADALPDQAAVQSLAGASYMDAGEYKRAAHYYAQGYFLDPEDGEAAYHLGEAYYHLGNMAAAERFFERAKSRGVTGELSDAAGESQAEEGGSEDAE